MSKIYAQSLTLPGDVTLSGPAGFSLTSLTDVVSKAVVIIIAFAGIGLLLMIISAGFSMLTGGGDPKKMEAGKQRLTNGLLGFFIVIGAYWITQLVGTILGFTQITDLFQ